jgi:hypothetical protein
MRSRVRGPLRHRHVRALAAGMSEADIAGRFEDMEAASVDVQVISVATHLPVARCERAAADLARRLNDCYVERAHEHPDKLRALPHLPHPHADAWLRELERGPRCTDHRGVRRG